MLRNELHHDLDDRAVHALPARSLREMQVFAIYIVCFSPSCISCDTIMYILRYYKGALYLTFSLI